jgi:hypothetical protein
MKRHLVSLILLSLFVVGCGSSIPSDGTSSTTGTDSALLDPSGNIVLYVINRSSDIDPVDMEIRIDGELVCSRSFERDSMLPDTGTSFVLQLALGQHVLSANSTNGEASLETSFTVAGEHWAILDYEYAPMTAYPPVPRQFRFTLRDEPILFD